MISRLTVIIAALLGTVTWCCLELKDITFSTTDAGKVIFSHTVHLQKKTRTTSKYLAARPAITAICRKMSTRIILLDMG